VGVLPPPSLAWSNIAVHVDIAVGVHCPRRDLRFSAQLLGWHRCLLGWLCRVRHKSR
jgi:hypothetical protein